MGWFVFIVVLIVIFVAIAQSVTSKPKARKQTQRSSPPARHQTPRTSSLTTDFSKSRRTGAAPPATWFGSDTELKVGGFRIKSPCVYASSGSDRHYWSVTDPSEIFTNAPVRRSNSPVPDLGYWPWYSRLEPDQRFEYLTWLTSGKASLPSSDGYLFLYFYGIERRLLVDKADRAWGLNEIVRLRHLDKPRVGTREGRSFRQYSTALLWYEIARTPKKFDQNSFDLVVGLTERWTPELLTSPLSWLAERNQPLPASIARQIAANHPGAQRSVVTKRVSEEFNELFETRYLESTDGQGLQLRISKRQATHTYRPASGGLSEMRCQVPNPMGIRSQFKNLPEIWNSCIADLRKLSRVSLSIEDGEMNVDAWEALPTELRADVDHPLTDQVTALLEEHSEPLNAGHEDVNPQAAMAIAAGHFAELLGIERRPKLTPTQSRNLATTIEYTGYGLVPDARITPIRYRWDDLVAVVPGLDDGDVESARYNAATCVLRLGLSIALADGEADALELRMLTDHIDAVFDLSTQEQQRLSALRDLLLKTGSDIRTVARKIEKLMPLKARPNVGRLLVVIAAASNGIDRSERAALRKAFRALDLPPELLEETIAEILPEAGESEIRVKAAGRSKGKGEPISAEAIEPAFKLNHEAISRIMSETREVSEILAAAMSVVDEEIDAPVTVEKVAEWPSESAEPISVTTTNASNEKLVSSTTRGPGGRYEPLFTALISQDRWDREEADQLARSHGLMLDASVEAINEWAFYTYDGPLIEDEDDELTLDLSMIKSTD